jgi:hypothetical protein
MEAKENIQIVIIRTLLPWLERGGMVLLVVAATMMVMKIPAQEVFMIAMGTLSIVFFLNAQVPPVMEKSEKPFGFKDMLAFVILPKIMWISSSVCIIGILFSYLGLTGATQMLIVGAGSLAIAAFILFIFSLSGMNLRSLQPTFLRVAPVFVIALYVLTR